MRDPSFMPSHPTGVPAGLTDLTPVIVNHSPELASRRGFDSQPYEEDLQIRNQLFEQKQPAAMDHYGGISAVAYRSRAQEQISPIHTGAYLSHHQTNFANNSVTTPYSIGRASTSANYEQAAEPAAGHYSSSLQQYGRVTEWQPQQGPPGTEIQISLVTQLKIDVQRGVVARFARDDVAAVCQGGHEHTGPYRYLVTAQAPAPAASTQWSKPKSAIPLCLFIPYENIQSQPQAIGTYTYTDTSAAASPTESELEQPRRPSEAGYKYEPESPRHGSDMGAAQLPPIKPDYSTSTGYYAASTYSTSGSSDGYSGQPSTSSYYTPSLVSSYVQTPGCTPPTPSWTGTASSTAATMEPPASMMMSMSGPSTGLSSLRANPMFVRARSDGVAQNISDSAGAHMGMPNPYSQYSRQKAALRLVGNLNDMTMNWSAREKKDKRRLVQFNRTQDGGTIIAGFEPVDPDQRPPNAIVVSCIWWEAASDFYVTSVDTIGLLEKLTCPSDKTFTVEEKNRIRRNLEGYHPRTIGKGKGEGKDKEITEQFFKLIMNFPVPRPRHIEKDVKVFKWKDLEVAMKKIISKYVPSYSSQQGIKRPGETLIHAEPSRPALSTRFSGAGTHSYHPSMPLSSTSSSFSDGYAQNYSTYSQPQPLSYPSYPSQQQHHSQYATTPTMPDNNHMMLQQHRPSVGYPSYMDNHGTTFMS